MKKLLLCLLLLLMGTGFAKAQTKADSTAIIEVALHYVESWYEGNAERMEKALHPDLAKRIVRMNNGQPTLQEMSAAQLIQAAGSGTGTRTPVAQQQKDVMILDIFRETASVKAVMSGWVDYMHLAKWNGEWKIVNVLWEMKPRQ